MAETLWLTRRMNALYASDGLAGNDLAKLPEGVRLKATITRPRSVPQNRLYWSMLKLVAENTDAFPTSEELHQAVKQALGYSRVYTRKGSQITPEQAAALAEQLIIIQGSIAFTKMDQSAFHDFFDRAADFMTAEVIPGIGRNELEHQAREMLGTG